MAKNAPSNTPEAVQAPANGVTDWRALAQPLKIEPPKAIEAALMGGPQVGHNMVIDRRQPGQLAIMIATDEQAMAEIFQAQPSKDKKAKDPNAVGARFLAKSNGPMYGSVPLDINGSRFYLKLTLEAARTK